MYRDDVIETIVEKDRIADVLNRLFVGTDARDWAAVEACFAGSVLFDMTSLAGGEPVRLTPRQITESWASGLAPIEAVHHQTGNLSVRLTGTGAEASCYGIAYHYRKTRSGRNTRVFVGSYEFHLQRHEGGWRIDTFRFKAKFIDGNRELESEPSA
jgi:3-phenylpropionate/cinnamic acid dioxygenase small subunit